MARPLPKRSHEPVFWLLFAAGGLLAALALPALIVATGIAGPLGLLPAGSLDYDRLSALLGSITGKLLAFVGVSLLFWHAMHRIFHGLHDLGLHRHLGVWRIISYGIAFLASLATAGLLAAL